MDRPLKSNGFILKSACYEATIGRSTKSPIVYVPIPYTKSIFTGSVKTIFKTT